LLKFALGGGPPRGGVFWGSPGGGSLGSFLGGAGTFWCPGRSWGPRGSRGWSAAPGGVLLLLAGACLLLAGACLVFIFSLWPHGSLVSRDSPGGCMKGERSRRGLVICSSI